MNITECKEKLISIEQDLAESLIVEFHTYTTPNGELGVYLTDRFKSMCKKGKIWKSNEMLTTLNNASYGFDLLNSRSRNGSDGIFKIDKNFKPINSMIKKLFNKFLNKPDELIPYIEKYFDNSIDQFIPVRLVSHHMRLLGLIIINDNKQKLVLIDFDNDK